MRARARRAHGGSVRFTCVPLLLLATACGVSDGEACRVSASTSPAAAGAELLFSHPDDSATFWHHPWPSDARRVNNRLLLAGFPNPTGSDTLSGYLQVIAANTRAYSRNAALYLAFDRPLDPSSLPASARASTTPESSLFLVDITAGSPTRGQRVPVDVAQGLTPTVYLPANHVTVLPPFGVSLRPGTTYALLGTTSIRGADGQAISTPSGLRAALDSDCADSDDVVVRAFAPLRAWLDDTGELDRDDLAVATVFTTQDAVADARALAEVARAEPVPAIEELVRFGFREREWLIEGHLDLPAFQEGQAPYTNPSDGGALARDAQGKPRRTGSQRARIAFVIPKGDMPAAGWPVVLYAHGTGGDHQSVYSRDIGGQLAARGIASVGYDGVVHGPRNPTNASTDLSFFNLFNIVAGRDNALQGAADNVVLTKLLQSGVELPGDLVDSTTPVRFDRTRVGYLGHSQGGLVGAPFVTMEPELKVAVFSGTSGVLTITLEERKDPVDFSGLLRTLLALPAEEVVGDTHPVLTLLQTFIEPADPIAYGPSFLSDPPGGRGRDVLLIEGFKDFASPPRGHEALASASGIPLVTPFHRQPAGSELLGLAPQAAPVSGNFQVAGGPVTAGLIQYPDQTHFPIFDDADANARAMEFLRSSLLDGRARIIEPITP